VGGEGKGTAGKEVERGEKRVRIRGEGRKRGEEGRGAGVRWKQTPHLQCKTHDGEAAGEKGTCGIGSSS
jgi:hypothetical protein